MTEVISSRIPAGQYLLCSGRHYIARAKRNIDFSQAGWRNGLEWLSSEQRSASTSGDCYCRCQGCHGTWLTQESGQARVLITDVAPPPSGPADQQISINDLQTAKSLTVPDGATDTAIQNNMSVALRWRDGGQTPTPTVGQRILPGDRLDYIGDLTQLRIIAEAPGTGALDIWYGK